MRRRHPDKEIENTLRFAEENGWVVLPGGGHAWGRMRCPARDEACRCGIYCLTSIWSTPRNTGNHARFLRRVVANCVFRQRVDDHSSAAMEPVMEYEFTLHFRLARPGLLDDAEIDRLFEAGCDDATVGLGMPGQAAVAFCRAADDARSAVESAIAAVQRALPDAELVEVAPDLGGLSDVAELVDVTRQNLRRLMLHHAGQFPAPTHAGSTLLWNMAAVLQWLQEHGGYVLRPGLLETTQVAWATNAALQARRMKRVQRGAR